MHIIIIAPIFQFKLNNNWNPAPVPEILPIVKNIHDKKVANPTKPETKPP